MAYLTWKPIIERAADIVRSYDTRVTLRQLFYRLVAEQLIPNTPGAYKSLSDRTAKARRAGTFPDLFDRGRDLHGGPGCTWSSLSDYLEAQVDYYGRDATEGQPYVLVVASEKATMLDLLGGWLNPGVLRVAVGGYSSQSYIDELVERLARDGRPAGLFYLGDHDASGWDIERDLVERTGDIWSLHTRIALNPDLVAEHGLPEALGKEKDSRTPAFVERFGSNVQVELEALPPTVLRQLVTDAVAPYWDDAAHAAMLARRDADMSAMRAFLQTWEPV